MEIYFIHPSQSRDLQQNVCGGFVVLELRTPQLSSILSVTYLYCL